MIRRPNTPDTLVQTRDGLLCPLQLLPAGLLEQVCLLEDLFRFEIPYADRFFSPVDVMALYDGMFVRPW